MCVCCVFLCVCVCVWLCVCVWVAIIRAEGESDTVKLISDATVSAGMGLIELRRIEASREIAATLAKSPNVAYLPGGKNLLMALNAGGC